MYACVGEIGVGFFAEVYCPATRSLISATYQYPSMRESTLGETP